MQSPTVIDDVDVDTSRIEDFMEAGYVMCSSRNVWTVVERSRETYAHSGTEIVRRSQSSGGDSMEARNCVISISDGLNRREIIRDAGFHSVVHFRRSIQGQIEEQQESTTRGALQNLFSMVRFGFVGDTNISSNATFQSETEGGRASTVMQMQEGSLRYMLWTVLNFVNITDPIRNMHNLTDRSRSPTTGRGVLENRNEIISYAHMGQPSYGVARVDEEAGGITRHEESHNQDILKVSSKFAYLIIALSYGALIGLLSANFKDTWLTRILLNVIGISVILVLFFGATVVVLAFFHPPPDRRFSMILKLLCVAALGTLFFSAILTFCLLQHVQ